VIISIDKRYPGHARKIMNACWGLGQLMFSKTVIVVDKDVDVQNEAEVAWIVGTHYDPERDIQFTRGPVDDLDDASDLHAYGSKMGIDATRKWPSEGFTRPWPRSPWRTSRPKADEVAEVRKGGSRRPALGAPRWVTPNAERRRRNADMNAEPEL
jgi:3-polyprenyl-4-hydroxybenzoate decarboxylase